MGKKINLIIRPKVTAGEWSKVLVDGEMSSESLLASQVSIHLFDLIVGAARVAEVIMI
ncbi:predicted protein [Histoplasma capsulatum var. duboisii H88]|uniref:Predicted protein n=2 Tax=Ajellomyces capsulatus TaxID=5037 RepID=F0UW78_AJEC8|nr:predicted protein [Histoplasma capsulatum H143]EGC42588.1 predicted protein [Histoplasma capsulatum var. duboisii H88]